MMMINQRRGAGTSGAVSVRGESWKAWRKDGPSPCRPTRPLTNLRAQFQFTQGVRRPRTANNNNTTRVLSPDRSGSFPLPSNNKPKIWSLAETATSPDSSSQKPTSPCGPAATTHPSAPHHQIQTHPAFLPSHGLYTCQIGKFHNWTNGAFLGQNSLLNVRSFLGVNQHHHHHHSHHLPGQQQQQQQQQQPTSVVVSPVAAAAALSNDSKAPPETHSPKHIDHENGVRSDSPPTQTLKSSFRPIHDRSSLPSSARSPQDATQRADTVGAVKQGQCLFREQRWSNTHTKAMPGPDPGPSLRETHNNKQQQVTGAQQHQPQRGHHRTLLHHLHNGSERDGCLGHGLFIPGAIGCCKTRFLLQEEVREFGWKRENGGRELLGTATLKHNSNKELGTIMGFTRTLSAQAQEDHLEDDEDWVSEDDGATCRQRALKVVLFCLADHGLETRGRCWLDCWLWAMSKNCLDHRREMRRRTWADHRQKFRSRSRSDCQLEMRIRGHLGQPDCQDRTGNEVQQLAGSLTGYKEPQGKFGSQD
ncbi:hypothetical protein INR49_012761, partial [Caranx melampygus]